MINCYQRGEFMKICIPTMGNRGLDEQVGEHFGRVPTYTLVDTETNEVQVLDNTSEHMGGSGYPPEIISRTGAEAMICSGLGRRAIGMFQELGIMVYVGAYGTVRDALKMWEGGQLQPATDENACRQHAFRREDHGDHHHHGY
jgi:predicted Fe-Mo cluster-binding NifX family protein